MAMIVLLSGCVGQGPTLEPRATDKVVMAVEHGELSERTVATILDVSPGIAWSRVETEWAGKAYRSGVEANFENLWYGVDRVLSGDSVVEVGDRVAVPAAGSGTLRILVDGEIVATYSANVPDTTMPATPAGTEPAEGAKGLGPRPSFLWKATPDPSGVSYSLQWSLDRTFSLPAPVTGTHDGITAPRYQLQGGEDLQRGRTYFWRVSSVDGNGNFGGWSQPMSFETAP